MKKNKKEIPMWAQTGHRKPVTRREFLASGLIPFSAWMVAPSIVNLLSQTAHAQSGCLDAAGSGLIPFITLNLAGGTSLSSQVVPKTVNGAYLKNYNKLGLGTGPGTSFNIEREFGNVEFAGTGIGGNVTGLVSKFLQSMRNPTGNMPSSSALAKTAFVWSAASSNDDSSNNPLDASGLVMKLGMSGSKLPNLGRSDTATGLNQQPALIAPPAPFIVNRVTDLPDALGYASVIRNLKPNQQSAIARLVASLTGAQTKRLASVPGSQSTLEMIDCVGVKNSDLISTGGGDVNPFTSGVAAQLAAIWGVNVNDVSSQNAIFAAMVYNGLVGNAATIALNMGGYDYHNNTRTTGDTRDGDAGSVVGKILMTAELVNKPVFVYVCSDGSVVSAESSTADSPWTSDRGLAGMQFILAFHPAGRPQTSSSQIGGFTDGQGADSTFPTGSNPELAAAAVFANYAAWNGKTSFLTENRIMDTATLSKVIKLQG